MTTGITSDQELERSNLLNSAITAIEDYLYSYDPTGVADVFALDEIISDTITGVVDATYEIEELIALTSEAVDA